MAKAADFENPTRFYALQVLHEVETTGAFADHVLERLWQTVSIQDVRDRRLVTVLVHGVQQWKMRLDWILDQFVRGGTERLDPWTHNALRLGVFQLTFLDRVPDWAVVDESVELAKWTSGRGAAGLVNAVLRRVADDQTVVGYPDLEKDPVAHISVVFSHPEWMVARWIDRYGVEYTTALCEFNNTARPVILRVNRLRASVDEVQRRLDAFDVQHRAGRYYPYSLELQGGVDVGQLSVHQEGLAQVQDEAASLVSLLVQPEAGERVVDACAAPGGKATHMAELMENRGEILAVDLHQRRLDQLVDNCRRLGITSVTPKVADARELSCVLPADRVLVDAPCSGLGVLARRSDARWHKSEEDIAALQKLQREILESAAQIVRPQGRLVYSTCTIEPEENEEVVHWFLHRHGDEFVQLSVRQAPIPGDLIDERGFYRALPVEHGIDGAFGAIFAKQSL